MCNKGGEGRGGMMMGHLSDWISGFKLRSDLWTRNGPNATKQEKKKKKKDAEALLFH